MRNYIFTCVYLLQSVTVYGQIDQSTEKWQDDIRFLQETVHHDYPFLFKKVTRQRFDREVEDLITRIPELEAHEITVGIARLVSLFGYGHTRLWLMGWEKDNLFGFHQMPFNLYYFGEDIFIQGVHQQFEAALGAEVLEVEGMPILEAMEKIRPVVAVENEQFFKAYGINYLGTPEVLHAQGIKSNLDDKVRLTLKKEGRIFQQVFSPVDIKDYPLVYGLVQEGNSWLEARAQGDDPYWLKNLEQIYYREFIPEYKTLYVRHSQMQDDSIDIPTFYHQVFEFIAENDVEKLILDVRLNGGGNNYKNKPIVTGIIACPEINQSDKLFVILGRRTFSACQNLVNELDNYTNATFVGEPTGENINFYGDNTEVMLPNSKIPVRLSFAWWQDKPPWENAPWLAPNLAVDLSFQDYQSNHDPVLEAIFNHNSDSATLDPMQYLTRLFREGKQDQIFPEAQKLINDSRYRYYPFEQSFNQLGYQLIATRQFDPAIMVLQLNNVLFPESANTWDSLAEAYWRSGDSIKAKQLYEKAIRMDPDGSVAENSRMMLERIGNME
jgi:tetratricopeptide (TPR) repeat protein